MLNIKWDEKLKPAQNLGVVGRWDEWFEMTADSESLRAWAAAKQITTSVQTLDAWATIIELNRLDRIKKKTPPNCSVGSV